MSVVSPPSSNTNVGNAGAGGSTTQLSAIAWATSSISINGLQANKLYPAITSGTQRAFSWFHSKSFRVVNLRKNGWTSGKGFAALSYPFVGTADPSPTADYSFRYDTYSYITLAATASYPYTFAYWAYGNASAPTSGSISGSNPVSIYSTDWTSTDYFYIWAVFS
jgi:hypothetical protein